MLIVKAPFVGFGYNMPNPGELIDPDPKVAEHLVSIGVAEQYETKVMPPPVEVKKNEPSESSRPARAAPKKTRKSSRKSATKS